MGLPMKSSTVEALLPGQRRQAQAELLQEHDRALGGPQERTVSNLGDVEPFVDRSTAKRNLQFTNLEAADLLGRRRGSSSI